MVCPCGRELGQQKQLVYPKTRRLLPKQGWSAHLRIHVLILITIIIHNHYDNTTLLTINIIIHNYNNNTPFLHL